MIFRLSQKLNSKITGGTLAAWPLDENPFADWSAHIFNADRTQYVIVCNTRSLCSAVMYGKGITNDRRFIDQALGCIRKFMEDDGHEFVYQRLVEPTTASVRFAKALNRSVTGSMRDLIFQATVWLTEGELSPHDVGFKLNDTPLSALAVAGIKAYAKPREVFESLLG